MSGAAIWNEKCPVCNGECMIQTWDKKLKKVNPSDVCPACEGKGNILIKKHIGRKKD